MATRNSTLRWKCRGTPDNPHPEIENGGYKCKLCGWANPDKVPSQKSNLSKHTILEVAIGIIVFLSIASYGLYQILKPCPTNYQKKHNTCVYAPNIFRNSNVHNEIFQ